MQKQKAPIPIPASVCGIIGRLNHAGYEAWAVGGCVRDSLLGRTPHDWDLCTSALPEQVAEVFRGERLLPTGLAHGTQTLLEDGKPYEITTYRVELGYSDGRHPDAVAFTPSLTEDLARRDFTVNAMACHPTLGLADPFGGQADLQAGVLRAVGDPEQRFSEDALRILRALRFAAVYGLAVEEHTARAARTLAPRLALVSRERVTQELWKLLAAPDGAAAARVLRQFPEVVREILPELAPCMGFDQHSAWHQYDVWEHQLHAMEAVQANTPEELPLLRLAALIHDIGKPETFQLGPDGPFLRPRKSGGGTDTGDAHPAAAAADPDLPAGGASGGAARRAPDAHPQSGAAYSGGPWPAGGQPAGRGASGRPAGTSPDRAQR